MNLKDLIKEKGFTNYRVAKDAKVGQATISELASGKRKHARLETAAKIAAVLKVDIEDIRKAIGGE